MHSSKNERWQINKREEFHVIYALGSRYTPHLVSVSRIACSFQNVLYRKKNVTVGKSIGNFISNYKWLRSVSLTMSHTHIANVLYIMDELCRRYNISFYLCEIPHQTMYFQYNWEKKETPTKNPSTNVWPVLFNTVKNIRNWEGYRSFYRPGGS